MEAKPPQRNVDLNSGVRGSCRALYKTKLARRLALPEKFLSSPTGRCTKAPGHQFRGSVRGTSMVLASATDSTLDREKSTGKYSPFAQGPKRSR